LHSVRYQTWRAYASQRVLVGVGNSGAEIAADLAEQGAALAAISIRTPPAIVQRDFLGTPVQVFGLLMSPLPPPLADQIGSALARLALGDLTRYGLQRPAWLPFTAKRVPIIDVGFVKAVKSGRVQVRPNLARFTGTGVVYDGGQAEDFDVVIAATGFTTGLAQWLAIADVLDTKGYPRHPRGQPTAQPGLFFLGYIESHRGHLYQANLASRRLAHTVAANLSGL
jgi:putative flavoprotein involved in K+ transport